MSVAHLNRFRGQTESKAGKRATKGKGLTIDELSPLIEPGDYMMAYIGRHTAYLHGRTPKLALNFRIVDPGPFFEVELERWYNCKRLVGKPGKNGNFLPPVNGSFLMEYANLFPTVLTRKSRLDRVSFLPFKNTVLTGRVETVKRNSTQKELPEVLQYSTIRELLKAGA